MNAKKILLFLFVTLLCSSNVIAQYGGMGGFGGFSQRDRDRQHQRFIESYKKKKENGDNVDGFYRSESAFNFILCNAHYQLSYVYPETYSSATGQSYFEGELETKVSGMGYGLGGYHYFPLSKTGENALTALTVGMEMNYIKFKFEELRLNGGQKFTPSQDVLQINFPLGLAYKTGTDVAFRKNIKSGFSIGGGAMLNANIAMAGETPAQYNVRPFGMAEIAFYTGFCWKLRVTNCFGNATLVKGQQNVGIGGSADESVLTLRTKNTTTLSLIITDFSWDWDEE